MLEDAAIDRARIALLEDLVHCATVLDDDAVLDGAAGLGSTVEVADEAGRTRKYRLIGRRTSDSPAHEVSLGSPVGRALSGARTGDIVHVGLPNGRERSLTVLGVSDGAGHQIGGPLDPSAGHYRAHIRPAVARRRCRVLINGGRPRGIARERAAVDSAHEVAKPQLRPCYRHEPGRFERFLAAIAPRSAPSTRAEQHPKYLSRQRGGGARRAGSARRR